MIEFFQIFALVLAFLACLTFVGITIAFIPVGGPAAPLLAAFLIVGSASYLMVEAIIHNPRFFFSLACGGVAFFVGV